MLKKVFFLILLIALTIPGISIAKEGGQAERLKASMSKLQVPFIENRGQVHEDVAYYAKTFGGTVFVTKDGRLVYSLPEGSRNKGPLKGNEEGESKPIKGVALYESFVDGTIKGVKGEAPSVTKVSYFKGNDPSKWRSGVNTYSLISLGEVYKGIELKLKAHGNNVEKLFYVKPGSRPEEIRIKLEGVNGIKVNEKGELEISTALGAVTFTKPVAYQEIEGKKVDVEVSYKVIESKGDDKTALYAFNLGNYDKTRELVIDPLLASTFIGGSGYDYGYSIALDSTGNVYVTGRTNSSDYPTTSGAYDRSFNGILDVFISKLNSDLSELLASTFIGGSGYDYGYSIALDSAGNVYVTGYTESYNYPTTSGAYYTSHNGSYDVFVSKLNSDLSELLASTFIGGSYDDGSYSIALDSEGNVYVTGGTYSSNYPTIQGAYNTSHNGGWDVFVSKLNSDLSELLASTFIGGSDFDYGYSIALDSAGNVYVTGGTYSSDYPTTSGAYDTSHNGGWDVFVSRLDANLSTTYTLTVTKEGTGSGMVTSTPAGISCGSDCTEDYPINETVLLTAEPAADSWVNWGG
ncbi:DUF7948 domain-containing protein, partial [Fervidobacterium sp.]